jgi:ATP-dependent RNA helicase RhlE
LNFQAFPFHRSVVQGIEKTGYIHPTPIQIKAIPEIMKGRDVMGLAQTGTGKTAAFLLPILNRLVSGPRGRIRALILAPTRELAEQIHGEIRILGDKTRLRSITVYGGVNINPQIRALQNADIVVGCPGRLLDHINRGTIKLSSLEVLVLDEADQMFDMGFFPDIRRILRHLPKENRQTLLFSATMPKDIRKLADEILQNPKTIQIGMTAPAKTVSHALFPVEQHQKTALLMRLLADARTSSVLVFTRTKHRARSLDKKLAKAGYRSTSLQGNLSQSRRKAAMESFRSGENQILVATDIAARGIDISHVTHVINFDMPTTTDAYIHRIGRTGRAKSNGEAFTLVTEKDESMVRAINGIIGSGVEKRFLTDFNYDAPVLSEAQTGKPGGSKQKPGGRGRSFEHNGFGYAKKRRHGRRAVSGL